MQKHKTPVWAKNCLFWLYTTGAGILLLYAMMWSSQASAQTSIKLAEPNWNMTFQPLQNSSGAPKLNVEEYPVVDNIRPLLDHAKYPQAMAKLQQQWPATPSAALLYIRAQIATQLQQYARAEQDYRQSIKQHGDYILAWQSLSGLALRQNQHKKSQHNLAKTIALGGSSAALFGQLAYLNLRHHSAFSSVSAYQRAYALEPENKHWQQGLLMSLSKSGAHHQANSLVDELLQQNPDNTELWLHKANAAIAADKPTLAISALEMAVRLGNNQAQNLQLLAQLHLQSGNIKRAVDLSSQQPQLLDDYEFIKPVLAWLSRHQRWQQLQQLINHSKSSQAQYRSDQRSDWLCQRAKLAEQQQRRNDSRKYLQQAIQLDPANGEALLLLAARYQQQQRLSRADMLLSRASVLEQYREQALLKRAQLAYQQQRYRSAFNYIKQVLQANPARRDLVENMDILQRLIRQQSQQT